MEERKIVAVSGGFDPIHSGHINLLREASELGDVLVILNSDAFLQAKKGRQFMHYQERKSILEAIRYVKRVVPAIDTDMTVRDSLRLYRPHIFANGGDRTNTNTPETTVCEELGITQIYNVGGGKTQSSSALLTKYSDYDLV